MLFRRKSKGRDEPEAKPAAPTLHPQATEPLPAAPRPPTVHADAGGTPTQSLIGESVTIVGDLHSEGDVRLDGRVCGNVSCAQLIVGKDADISGAVMAKEAIVRGRITGTIRAEVIIIQSTARIESDVTYRTLAIDDGAAFEGSVCRSDNPLAEEVPAASSEDQKHMTLAEPEAPGAGTSGESDAGQGAHAGSGCSPEEHSPAEGHEHAEEHPAPVAAAGSPPPARNGRDTFYP